MASEKQPSAAAVDVVVGLCAKNAEDVEADGGLVEKRRNVASSGGGGGPRWLPERVTWLVVVSLLLFLLYLNWSRCQELDSRLQKLEQVVDNLVQRQHVNEADALGDLKSVADLRPVDENQLTDDDASISSFLFLRHRLQQLQQQQLGQSESDPINLFPPSSGPQQQQHQSGVRARQRRAADDDGYADDEGERPASGRMRGGRRTTISPRSNSEHQRHQHRAPKMKPQSTTIAVHFDMPVNESQNELRAEQVSGYGYVYSSWQQAEWSTGHSTNPHFEFIRNTGAVTVKKNGVYFVYAQLLYNNSATRSSYGIMIDNVMLTQCWTSVDAVTADLTASENARLKTCYVGTATQIHRHQTVWIRDLYRTSISRTVPSNYFGIIKLADLP
jgi:hypothetical protein